MTVASRLSTTGMDVLVGEAVGGESVGVSVSVGGASAGTEVSVGITTGSVAVEVTGADPSTGAADGRLQAMSRKIRVRKVARIFFISIYL